MLKVLNSLRKFSFVFLMLLIVFQPLIISSFTKVYAEAIEEEPIVEVINTAPVFNSNSIITSNWGMDIVGLYSLYLEPTLKPVVGGQVTISTNVTDAENNLVTVRGGINPVITDIASNINGISNGNYQIISFDSTAYTDGILDIRIDGVDGVLGTEEVLNTVSNNFEIIVDNTAPTIEYGSDIPLNLSVVSGTVILEGIFGDNIGLWEIGMSLGENVVCVLGPTDIVTNDTPSNGIYTCEVDTTAFEDGIYPIIMVAIDKAGNVSEIHSQSIELDNFEEPEDTTAPIFTTKDVTRDEGEAFPDLSEFVLNNPENLPVFCSTVNASDMVVNQPNSNKLFPITCYVEDSAGNRTTSTSNLIVNNVQPKVVIIANPSIVVTEGTSVSLVGNITSGKGSFNYNWYGSCSGTGSLTSLGLTNSVNTPTAPGSYLCGISVTDQDGDTAAASVRIDVLANGANSSTPNTTNNNQQPQENPSTTPEVEDQGEVEGVSTEVPVSAPVNENESEGNNNQNNLNDVAAAGTASPLVIICLVAGAILIIALLLFLFFRGEDVEEDEIKDDKK